MRRMLVVVLVLLGCSATFAAAGAMSATYCVNDPACPSGGISSPDLPAALQTAGLSDEADTVRLGPGTYTDPNLPAQLFQYSDRSVATNAITIQGAGPDQTILTQADTGTHLLDFADATPDAKADVRDLTVSLPPGFGSISVSGIARPTQAENVRVTAQGAVTSMAVAIEVGDYTSGVVGPFTGIDVQLPVDNTASAFRFAPAGNSLVTVTDSSLTGGFGISLFGGVRSTLQRLRVRASAFGIAGPFRDDGTHENVLEDSQIRIDGGGTAVVASPPGSGGADATLAIRHTTLVGSGGAAEGVRASALNGHDANVRVRNSIVSGFSFPLRTTESTAGGPVTAALTASNSVITPGGDDSSAGGTITREAGTNSEVADPVLVDGGGGDLYPRFDSPAVDLGDPAFTFNTVDLAHHSRVIDGNGDGNVLPDAGAFEYQRRAPSASASYTPPAVAGTPTAFTGSASDPDPGDSLTYGWLFSDSGTSSDQSPSHTFGAGPFSATLTATDPTGLAASSTLTGVVASAPVPPDTTAPVVTGVAFSPKSFRASVDSDTAANAKRSAGSTLKLKLSEPATVTVKVAEKRSGRKKGSRCVAQTKKNRKAKRCTFYTTRATLTRKGLSAGASSIQFTGRFKGKSLKPASYRATMTAADAAGNKSKAVTATFKIKRR